MMLATAEASRQGLFIGRAAFEIRARARHAERDRRAIRHTRHTAEA